MRWCGRPGATPSSSIPLTEPQTQLSVETVAGLRLTPELTVRAGYYGYREFGEPDLESHAACSIVWTQRWH